MLINYLMAGHPERSLTAFETHVLSETYIFPSRMFAKSLTNISRIWEKMFAKLHSKFDAVMQLNFVNNWLKKKNVIIVAW